MTSPAASATGIGASYFVTATDTGAGKTFVTALLLRALAKAGGSVVGFKPIACGDRDDAEVLRVASSPSADLSLDDVNPLFFKTPAAPLAAGMIENRAVDPAALTRAFDRLARRFDRVLVEGVGGWEVPVAPGFNVGDLAAELGSPVILVVNNRLGALNHTILTANAIAARGLRCAGIILNHVEDERDSASVSNRVILEQELDVPILCEVLHGECELDSGALEALAG